MILILLNRNTYTRFTGVNEVEKDNGKVTKVSSHFVNCDSVDVGVIHEPDNLVWEEFSVILWG